MENRYKELTREICAANDEDIESGNMSPDHIHLLITVSPNVSVSEIVQ